MAGRWTAVRFGILGPLEVTEADKFLRIEGRKLRTLLTALLVDSNEVVSTDKLISALWPSSSSATQLNALQSQVSRLRTILDSAGSSDERRLVSHGSGYLIRARDDELDALEFESLGRRSRDAIATQDWSAAVSYAERALGCWRGDALEESRHEEFARARATQLEEERLLTIECRIEAGLALGQHSELVGQLEALVIQHPLRESLWSQLMLALYRSGRQSDALRAYDRVRRTLAEELGMDPGVELVKLREGVLNHDPTLDRPLPEPTVGAPSETRAAASTTVRRKDDEPHEAGSAARHNLPSQLTSFVGRPAERAAVADELGRSSLVTLTGSGGCGKTRLALQVAREVLPRFAGGVWFVDLASVSDPDLVDRVAADSLGVEVGEDNRLDLICRRIGHEGILLVLDNCEHLVDAAALLAENLLARCPAARILATSREDLRADGEVVLRVPGLSLPATDGGDGIPFDESEAVQLFMLRARSALAGFAPTGETQDHVTQICRRLDGIPLAIELAAALVGSMPVADIAENLDERFRLLSQGRRHSIGRHRTLRATLDWSFELLDEPAQQLLVRLAVFVGDFTLAAAGTVAGTESDPLALARGLMHLVATSMVTCVVGREGADRYRMLETVRQYALERLEQIDVADEVRWRHARYYADLAEDAERHVHGPTALEWLARVASELPNLRAAVAWTIDHDDTGIGLRLVGSLRWYFDRMGLLDEAARWLHEWLNHATDLPLDLRLRALTAASTLEFMQGEFSQTRQLGEEGVAIARRLGDVHQLALALIVRGSAAVYEGEVSRAEECFEEADLLCAQLGDEWGKAWNLTGWGICSRRRGQLDRARRQLTEALDIFGWVGDRHGQLLPLVHLALVAHEAGKTYDALTLASEALETAREVGDRRYQHITMCVLGRIELSLDHLDRARDLLVRSIRGFVGSHHQSMVAIALEGLAGLAGLAGRHGDAAALLGFTYQLRDRSQLALSDHRAGERAAWIDGARTAIGPDQLELELVRGRSMEREDAFDLAEAATTMFDAGGPAGRSAASHEGRDRTPAALDPEGTGDNTAVPPTS
jgi:predicted ATPase/DNA-binding SARP family transcriptional activator